MHVRGTKLADVDGILVGVEAAVVEAGVGVGDTQCERRTGAVRGVDIAEVDVVGAEVLVAEWRARCDRGTLRSGSSGTAVLRGSDGQGGGEEVIVGAGRGSASCVGPDDVDCVQGVGVGVLRRAEKSDGAGAGDVQLLSVVAWLDKDRVGDCIVGKGEDGGLHSLELASWPDKDSALRASGERIASWCLTRSSVPCRCGFDEEKETSQQKADDLAWEYHPDLVTNV